MGKRIRYFPSCISVMYLTEHECIHVSIVDNCGDINMDIDTVHWHTLDELFSGTSSDCRIR